MYASLDIHYFSDPIQNSISLLYWAFWPEGSRKLGFIYPIEQIAGAHGISVEETLEAVRNSSAASVRCAVCHTSFPLKYREEMEALQYNFNGHNVMCPACSAEVRGNAAAVQALHRREMRNCSSLLNPGQEETFGKLRALFPYVFPSISPDAFIDAEVPYGFSGNGDDLHLFDITRFSYAVADEDGNVLAVIDHPPKHLREGWKLTLGYRRKLLELVGVPYYVFPGDRKRFFSHEAGELLRFSELGMKLRNTGMLDAAAFITQSPPF